MLAARLGAHVTLSDACHLPHCLENCHRSCQANGLMSVEVIGLTWGQFSPEMLQLGLVDVILGSDCFYDGKGEDNMVHEYVKCNRLLYIYIWLVYCIFQISPGQIRSSVSQQCFVSKKSKHYPKSRINSRSLSNHLKPGLFDLNHLI